MNRPLPFLRSHFKLGWSIRQNQRLREKPSLRAIRRPFAATQPIRGASCTYWLKDTAKDSDQKPPERCKPHKLVTEHKQSLGSAEPVADKAAINNTFLARSNVSAQDPTWAEKEIIQLYQDADFLTMYNKLNTFEAQGISISKDIVADIMANVYENPPIDSSVNYLLQSPVEQPFFFIKYSLRLQTRYASYSTHVKHLYDIATLLEKKQSFDDQFLKIYIWLCYHMEDLSTLQRLLYKYLQSPTYDTRTLSYIINAFTYSYDVEYAKSLFISIIGMGRPLDESLLSSTLFAFIRVKALYDNNREIYNAWMALADCESPHPKTVAMFANQTYMYGTEKEIAAVEADIQSLGYENNFLVQLTRTQTAIVLKDTNKKKTISQDEIKSILEVRNTLGRTKYALKVYYESYIRFFSIHCDMAMIQFILKEMKKDGIPLSRYCYEMISNHYVSDAKFFQLFQFMKRFVTRYTQFDLFFVRQMFHAFIKSYPHHAETFSRTFDMWIQESPNLSNHDKHVLQGECQVSRSNSSMTPFKNSPTELKNKNKYSSSNWAVLGPSSGSSQDRSHKKHVVQSTEEEGIKNLLRKGIRPHYFFIEDLLKKLNKRERTKLLRFLPTIRMTRTLARLRIYDFLLDNPNKDKLAKFYRQIGHELNTSNKILLARRTLNSNDYATTAEILDSIGSSDMTDSRRMLLLNLKLRNNLGRNDIAGCTRDIESFALDKITLNPYIHIQCRYIEKMVRKKIQACIKHQEALVHGNGDIAEKHQLSIVEELRDFHQKLQGFIGDVQIRLKKDQLDMQILIEETFQLLSQWADSREKTGSGRI